jgi:glucose-1-phosphatase
LETKNIKNLIFDFGAVIIDIEPSLTIEAFARLMPHQTEALKNQVLKSELFNDFEKGFLDAPIFWDKFRETFQTDLDNTTLEEAWNRLLLDIPLKRITLLQKLQKNYRTFLLSNTNITHIDFIKKNIVAQKPIPSLESLFEKVYLSYEMGKRKPDEDIYLNVLEEQNLKVEETLFLDDNADNIQTAHKLGFQVAHIIPTQREITDIFIAHVDGSCQIIG